MLAHPMTETAIFTYKARVHVTPEQDALPLLPLVLQPERS